MDPNSGLDAVLLLAKSARGAGCREIIKKATSAPDVHAFGELLDLPQVTELEGGPHAAHLELLKLFAFGTYPDYKARAAELPELNDKQARKLKLLTIVSLATQLKRVPYQVMQEQLDTADTRQLEDLIIDAIYRGLIGGKMDQANQRSSRHTCTSALQLIADWTFGRDIVPGDIDKMIGLMSTWHSNCESTLAELEAEMRRATAAKQAAQQAQADHDAKVSAVRAAVEAEMEREVKDRD
ncbi:hypothetical protein PTSG_11200 [Salpingoeca rosetta]|uniref:PCI domain-containing protein n=1 Tax=Salpingoeca rosetta (strain ATCC 50818 / BSB-021) TaxID=946362 RepID=F2USQ1_SALR5|nr:uncharacterized protein PTSG_11200 [Salpingoeca rosetta]EGD81160.1 hypothetical protein PTSG_11200 [Salpingoeca rosetta]|eukprot:XP_004987845.1 hypothetical protein PTSG_11200 [Salpingoeca rosetta]